MVAAVPPRATGSWLTTVSGGLRRTYHPVSARQARYVRLAVSSPTNVANDSAARIYELQVYGGGSPDLALGRTATGSDSCGTTETPDKAVNGSYNGGNSDKWCSKVSGTKTLTVDLGASHALTSLVVRHAGAAWGEPGLEHQGLRPGRVRGRRQLDHGGADPRQHRGHDHQRGQCHRPLCPPERPHPDPDHRPSRPYL